MSLYAAMRTVRASCTIAFLAALNATASAQPRRLFTPLQYMQPDGALTVFRDGLFVEPYFAARALLSAQDAGLDARGAGHRYIDWYLARAAEDSSPSRYCREPASGWRRCGEADADDAALALWALALHVMAPAPMPVQWRRAAAAALRQLERLRDPLLGVYRISPTLSVALVMDNLEIAAAFDAIARARANRGDGRGAAAMRRQAAALHRAIDRTFFDTMTRRYRVTTQARAVTDALYPDQVAQLYPVLFGHALSGPASLDRYRAWQRAHARDWLASGAQDFPWGLIALGALRMHDRPTAGCWLAAALPFRQGPRWNLLEEASAQAVEAAVVPAGGAPPPCLLPTHE